MIDKNDIVYKNIFRKEPDVFNIEEYSSDIKKILSFEKEFIFNNISASYLRGRGNLNISIESKWEKFQNISHKKLIISATESEPFAITDKSLLKYEQKKIILGIFIVAFALDINEAFLMIKESYKNEAKKFKAFLAEFYKNNLLGKNILNSSFTLNIHICIIPDKYIFDEESTLINYIYYGGLKPIQIGSKKAEVFKRTLVHNIETIAMLYDLMTKGHLWFYNLGTRFNTGTKLFRISGDVVEACLVEEEYGISLRKLLNFYAGDVLGGMRNLYAIMPGFNPPLSLNECHAINLDADSFISLGSFLGSGNIRIFNSRKSLINHLFYVFDFFEKESCGDCIPCGIATKIFNRALHDFFEKNELDNDLIFYAKNIKNAVKCNMMQKVSNLFLSITQKFREKI